MDKNHNCLERVRKELMDANPEIISLHFPFSMMQDMNKRYGINMTGQEVKYIVNQTREDGKVVQKVKRSFVIHDYCPFCGEKYID